MLVEGVRLLDSNCASGLMHTRQKRERVDTGRRGERNTALGITREYKLKLWCDRFVRDK